MKEKSEQDTDEDVDMIQSFSVVSEEMKTEDKKEKKKSKEKENQEKVEEVSNPGYIIKVTDEEVAMLERIVQAEAGSEDIKGRILVANVILNRVANEDFPDTIKEVIFQNSNGDYQFSPVSDKRYWSVKVTKNTKESVERALKGEDYSEGALYFMARKRAKKNSAQWFDNNLTWLFQHGGHEFYK
ncbi:MAG: cell wall hydrolase [Clostridiales bacterium]|nr:cell wall hydrolase [Clostridiales bacterium]